MRRSVRWAIPVAAATLLVACGGSEGLPGGPSSERVTLHPAGSVQGTALGYFEYLPPGYGDGEPRPLLLSLHPVNGNGDGTRASLELLLPAYGIPRLIQEDEWPEDRPFVVLAPQHPSAAENACPEADEVDGFVRFAVDEYDVDPQRVYLTGMSCGATGIWSYLQAHGGRMVAAVVPIAGDPGDAFDQAGCGLGRVPIWAFHGARDPIVPKSLVERTRDELAACQPPPVDFRLTIQPDAYHDAWSRTYDLSTGHDVYAWLLEHERD